PLPEPLPPDGGVPGILVQMPTYNDGALVERVLEAVTALDWPRDRLEIQVLDDSTDASAEMARIAVERFRARGHAVTLLHRDHRFRFKAGGPEAGPPGSQQPF